MNNFFAEIYQTFVGKENPGRVTVSVGNDCPRVKIECHSDGAWIYAHAALTPEGALALRDALEEAAAIAMDNQKESK